MIFDVHIVQAPPKDKKETKEKKAKRSTTELSKDEETIKRLKVLPMSSNE